jgi:hypothetical protein
MKILALLLSIAILAACERPIAPPKLASTFEVVEGTKGSLAIRKETGELCRTYDWADERGLPLCGNLYGLDGPAVLLQR